MWLVRLVFAAGIMLLSFRYKCPRCGKPRIKYSSFYDKTEESIMRWRTCQSCNYTEMMIRGKWSTSKSNAGWEEKGRQFFLGTLPEDEREDFEIQFMLNDTLADELEVIEQKLIEDFAEGDLSEADNELFIKNYLISDERRRRVAAEQTFLKSMAPKAAQDTE